MSTRSLLLFVLFLFAFGNGCSCALPPIVDDAGSADGGDGDGDGDGDPDAGDGDGDGDGGVLEDGGVPDDGGVPVDGGLIEDGGIIEDGGSNEDGGINEDGGVGLDGGLVEDGGALVDAGPIDPSAPVAEAGPDRAVLPDNVGAQPVLVLDGSATDPDSAPGQLTFLWTYPALPDGVSVSGADTEDLSISIDRAVYDPDGVGDRVLSFTLTVEDEGQRSDSDSVIVTVLDERGPFVNLDSPYSGTDPSEGGYCGHISHPCNTIDDALVNLQDALDDGASYASVLRVATPVMSVDPYTLDETLQLNDGISLACGYDPTTTDEVTGWALTSPLVRSALRSTADIAVRISGLDGVTVSGCDIEGLAQADGPVDRVGVEVVGVVATLDDNRIVADASDSGNAENAWGVHLVGQAASEQVVLTDNDIEGGAATDVAAGVFAEAGVPHIEANLIYGGVAGTNAVGVHLDVPDGEAARAQVVGNVIEGGIGGADFAAGQAAAGVFVERGNPAIDDNDIAGGSTPGLNVGVSTTGVTGGVTMTNNTIVGTDDAAAGATLAIGLSLYAPAVLSDNAISGGAPTASGTANLGAIGLLVEGEQMGFADGAEATSTNDLIVGGTFGNIRAAISVDHGGALSVVDGAVLARVPAGAPPTVAWGVALNNGSTVDLVRTGVETGGASAADNASAAGVIAFDAASSISISGGGVTVDPGATGAPIKVGVQTSGGPLTLAEDTGRLSIDVGAGATSNTGVLIACAEGDTRTYQLSGIDVVTYGGGASQGLLAAGCDTVRVINGSFSAADQQAASGVAVGANVSEGALVLENIITTAGDAGTLSAGVLVSEGRMDLVDVQASAGNLSASDGALSAGIVITDPVLDGGVGSFISGATFGVGGDVTDTLAGESAGLLVSSGLGGLVSQLQVVGTGATPLIFAGGSSNATSSGVRIFGGTLADFTLRFVEAYGDGAPFTAGMAFQGANPSNLTLLDSVLVGGTSSQDAGSALSTGLFFSGDCSGCTIDANIIEAGASQPQGRSVGLRMISRAEGAIANTTVISNNLIGGGAGTLTEALELSGEGGAKVRVLHNYLHGGTGNDRSVAVFLGRQIENAIAADLIQEPAMFGGNHLDAGEGGSRYGFFENCRDDGVFTRRAQPARAANSNFIPSGDATPITAMVRRAGASLGNCTVTNVTSVAAVNGTGPYAVVGSCGASLAVDPAFVGDPLEDPTATNPALQGAADMTYACPDDGDSPLYPGGSQMPDFFNTFRIAPNIGPFEAD